MSTNSDLPTKEDTQKKLSKRQRRSIKSQTLRLKAKKKEALKAKSRSTKKLTKSSKIAVDTDKDSQITTKKIVKKKKTVSDHIKTAKCSTSEAHTKNAKPRSKRKKAKHIQKTPQITDAADVLHDQEIDKNWKDLSKKLGIKKKKMESPKQKPIEKNSPVKEHELWFDDVEDIFIEKPVQEDHTGIDENGSTDVLIKPGTKAVLTKCLAMDCEMVGVGPSGDESVLARISVVNQYGHCVYDKFVKPKEEVTDYRTWVSGVRPEDLETAEELETVQKEVNEMFKGRLLVGHAISNDEKVLFLNHPKKYVRDTQKYPGFRNLVGGRKPSLKMLAQKVLGVKIQSGEHSSIQDAQATMRLYTMVQEKWEKRIRERARLNKHQRNKLLNKKSTTKAAES